MWLFTTHLFVHALIYQMVDKSSSQTLLPKAPFFPYNRIYNLCCMWKYFLYIYICAYMYMFYTCIYAKLFSANISQADIFLLIHWIFIALKQSIINLFIKIGLAFSNLHFSKRLLGSVCNTAWIVRIVLYLWVSLWRPGILTSSFCSFPVRSSPLQLLGIPGSDT